MHDNSVTQIHNFAVLSLLSHQNHPEYDEYRLCGAPRLFMRGIDSSGHVANMVETEQIVEFQGDRVSFVQVSGNPPQG